MQGEKLRAAKVWWFTVVLVLGRLRQEGFHGVKANLGGILRTLSQKTKYKTKCSDTSL